MKSYVVFGLGRFGRSVARTLFELGNEVLAIDEDEDAVRKSTPYTTLSVEADITDEETMSKLGIGNYDVAIVAAASNLEAAIYATLTAKELGVKKVIAKAQNDTHGMILKKVGADKVVFPEWDMGVRIAHNLASGSIVDFIDLSEDYSIVEMLTKEKWVGKTLQELRLPNKYGFNVIAIKRSDKIIISPKAEQEILLNDVLIIVGKIEEIKKI